MKNDLTKGTWQDNIWCPINIILFCTSDVVSSGNFASMEFQGQEVLSLWDTLRCSTRESIRWHHCKNYAWHVNTFGSTYKNQRFFLVHEWRVSVETCLIIWRLLRAFSTRRSTSKSGTRKDYLLLLRSSTTSTFKCLIKILCSDVASWAQPSGTLKIKMTARKVRWVISPDSRASHPLHF